MTGKFWNIARLMAFGLMMQACASSEPISPLARAVGAGQEKIDAGRTKGQTEADGVQGIYLKIRHNPARCDVPAFEVYSHERWTRAYLDGSQEIQQDLRDFERRSRVLSAASFLEVSGKFSGRRRTESGVRFPVFMISDLREAAITDSSSRPGT